MNADSKEAASGLLGEATDQVRHSTFKRIGSLA